jgi:hypothetical protein
MIGVSTTKGTHMQISAALVLSVVDRLSVSESTTPGHPGQLSGGSMKAMTRMFAVVGILALSFGVHAQTDPTLGTWKLNLAKSKYNAGPPPKSSTVVIESAGPGITLTATTILADGSTRKITYTANYDGKDAVVTGTPDYDTIAIKKSGNSTEGMRKKGGKTVQTYTRTVSADGKTMTVASKGTNAAGDKVDNVQVYDRQ